MWIFIILSILVITSMAFWANIHANRIKRGIDPNKWGKAGNIWMKFMIAVLFSFIFVIYINNGSPPYPSAMIHVVGMTIYALGLMWLSFDLFLNLERGLPISYVSSTNGKLLDYWFRKSFWLQLAAKLTVIGLGITIYIVSS